ncbi:S1 family peptidase [Streptosporangium sp. NPDC002524]|uniref:S1 family peptidase n=1 Tax=Streptosporangium sp. NPDC002524 TaxID=3154537 RepID=UPI00331A02EC
MNAQEPLRRAARPVMDAVLSSKKDLGFAGLKLEDGFVRVWWKGDVPAQVEPVLAQARLNAPVKVDSARFSREELRETAEAIRKDLAVNPRGPLHAVGIESDGSGVYVEAETPQARKDLGRTYDSIGSSVPVEIKIAERAIPAGRMNDTAPFYGGMRIVSDDGPVCTAGWPVAATSNPRFQYLLTAAHCTGMYTHWRNGDRSVYVGQTLLERTDHDLALIHVPDGVGRQMWDGGVAGGWNTSPEFSKRIMGWDHVYEGQWLCQSGQRSGAVCNFEVVTSGDYSYCGTDPYGNYACHYDLFRADQISGQGSLPGDSGGPVFYPNTAGYVHPVGVTSGSAPGSLIFQDIYTALADFPIQMRTY